jgi:hypothetical protein
VHARDREVLVGLSKVNSRIGKVTVELLTLQPNDMRYAAALRTLGGQLINIGTALAQRASELDGTDLVPTSSLDTPAKNLNDRTELSEP